MSAETRSWLEHGKPHGNGPVLDDEILADPEVKACIEEGSKARKRKSERFLTRFDEELFLLVFGLLSSCV